MPTTALADGASPPYSRLAASDGQLEEGRGRIQQAVDALAHGHLALAREAVEVALRAREARGILALSKLRHKPAVVRIELPEAGGTDIDHRADPMHGRLP
ncbi:MAG: hypothetical protein R3E48_00595 [Burkholderiaceae bacterium]